jgi:Spy/CpxP family protein refolding chaperone
MGDGPGMGPGHGGRGGGGHFPGMLLRNADELELTDQQIEKLEDIQVQFQTERIDARAQVAKQKVKLRSLMRDENADETDVMVAIEQQANLKAELHKLQYKHRKAVAAVLSQEQKDKLKALAKERRLVRRGGFDDDSDVRIERRERIHRIMGNDW